MTRPSAPGLLFLSHRGFSFMEDLIAIAKSRGLAVYVLSSLPEERNASRSETLRHLSDWCRVAPTPSLGWQDVASALHDLAAEGKYVKACLSVWDGYRTLMSQANHQLGAQDLPTKAVGLLNDKYLFRRTLAKAGLSAVTAHVLHRKNVKVVTSSGRRCFIKPRRGLASFGTFEMPSDLSWPMLMALRENMANDPEYHDVMQESEDFIVEDYIVGKEYSFEVIAFGGKSYVMGVHEKCEMEASGKTTLENACTSPPVGLEPRALQDGIKLARKALQVFGAGNGCFHIEARYDRHHHTWELIEINPRVGGAFINRSVKLLNGGTCLIELWLATLVSGMEPESDLHEILENLSMQANARPWQRTFFRVYFAQAGKSQLQEIRTMPHTPSWESFRVMAKNGDRLPSSSAREVFLGQALWSLSPQLSTDALSSLIETSKHALEVIYA